jgi:hypothetical protein
MLILIGGQASKIGKTSVVCALLQRLERQWTAVKVADAAHEPAGCEPFAHEAGYTAWRQIASTPDSDTGRYLASGASEALFVSAPQPSLADLSRWLSERAKTENLLVESTRLAACLHPDLFLLLMGAPDGHPKGLPSNIVKSADALLCRGSSLLQYASPDQPSFVCEPPQWMSDEAFSFVKERLANAPR